jgi:hypothetical protein
MAALRVTHLDSSSAVLVMLQPAACAGQIVSFASMHDGIHE